MLAPTAATVWHLTTIEVAAIVGFAIVGAGSTAIAAAFVAFAAVNDRRRRVARAKARRAAPVVPLAADRDPQARAQALREASRDDR